MLDFKIVEGLPHHVESDIKSLISSGWVLHGELFNRNVDGNLIVGQAMRRDDGLSVNNNNVFVYRIKSPISFDKDGLINLVYSREQHDRNGSFIYTIKVRGETETQTTSDICRELSLQTNRRESDPVLEFLHMEKYYV